MYNLASPPTPPPGQENVIFLTLKVAAHDICEANLVVSSIAMYKYMMFIVQYITFKLQLHI
jgi:hypothetical protein